MQDHDKTCQIIWLKEGFGEFHTVRFFLHSFSGSFEKLHVYQEQFSGGKFSSGQFSQNRF